MVVHKTCSSAYLIGELILLEPDILITQGATTNKVLGNILVGREIFVSELPKTKKLLLGDHEVLWMPMHHPTQQLNKIREAWPIYLKAAKAWAKRGNLVT